MREAWSVTTKEEGRLVVSENEVLRKKFGCKRNVVLGDRYFTARIAYTNITRVIITRIMRWVGHVARVGERSFLYSILLEKPEGKRHFERHMRRRKSNVGIDLREIDLYGRGPD